MPSTTIDIFSDVAINVDGGKLLSKFKNQGVLAQKSTVTVPATTASGSDLGMIPFQKGWNLLSFEIKSADLDTASNVTLDVGYIYDDSALTDDPNAFLAASTIAQGGTDVVYPTAGGLLTGTGFESAGTGFMTITIGGGATTTAGDIIIQANFTYDN